MTNGAADGRGPGRRTGSAAVVCRTDQPSAEQRAKTHMTPLSASVEMNIFDIQVFHGKCEWLDLYQSILRASMFCF